MPAENSTPERLLPAAPAEADRCVPVRGVVYGVALHGRTSEGAVAVAGTDADGEPDRTGPTAPVLFIKPRNTYLPNGGTVELPPSLTQVEVSATLGLVFGREVRGVSAAQALEPVAGLVLALDISEPGSGLFRPPIREKCRDGFLPIGPRIVSMASIAGLETISLSLEVDGRAAASVRVGDTLAQIRQSLEAISRFMTLRAGDVLLVARSQTPVRANVGSQVSVADPSLGRLECTIGSEHEVRP